MVARRGVRTKRSAVSCTIVAAGRRKAKRGVGFGAATVNALAEPFNISLPAISRHLKVLERAGLIARERDAQWRPCRLTAEPIKDVAAWAGSYRPFWEESFDKLDTLLVELEQEERTP